MFKNLPSENKSSFGKFDLKQRSNKTPNCRVKVSGFLPYQHRLKHIADHTLIADEWRAIRA